MASHRTSVVRADLKVKPVLAWERADRYKTKRLHKQVHRISLNFLPSLREHVWRRAGANIYNKCVAIGAGIALHWRKLCKNDLRTAENRWLTENVQTYRNPAKNIPGEPHCLVDPSIHFMWSSAAPAARPRPRFTVEIHMSKYDLGTAGNRKQTLGNLDPCLKVHRITISAKRDPESSRDVQNSLHRA